MLSSSVHHYLAISFYLHTASDIHHPQRPFTLTLPSTLAAATAATHSDIYRRALARHHPEPRLQWLLVPSLTLPINRLL